MNSVKRGVAFGLLFLCVSSSLPLYAQNAAPQAAAAAGRTAVPRPLAAPGKPVDWMFIFKFNAATFPGCKESNGHVDRGPVVGSPGIFGGKAQNYQWESQRYLFATSADPNLVEGSGCLGATVDDPLGATFGQIYDHPGYNYVLWNDQFYNNPIANESAPAGHSKGMVAWNDDGEGFVLQVSTPSWPASGSKLRPRLHDGNTLGSIKDDDIEVSQHFFALKLTKADLVKVLGGLANASVVTSIEHPEIVHNGGPADVQSIVKTLGRKTAGTECTVAELSTGVRLISKPSALAAPPWQVVSAKLDGLPLRVASWWARPLIYSTGANPSIEGWPPGLGKPGPVEIALSGIWQHEILGLTGGEGPNHNHAKIGISTRPSTPIVIFGDENQQGALREGYAYAGQKMTSSQNGRGGTFYVVSNPTLFQGVTALLNGATAPESGPNGER